MCTDSSENSSNRFFFLLFPECSSCRKHNRRGQSIQPIKTHNNTCGRRSAGKRLPAKWNWFGCCFWLVGKKKAVLANRVHTIKPEEQASRSVMATVNDHKLVFLCGWDLWNNLKIWNLGVNDKFSQQKEGRTIFKIRGAIYYSAITFIKIIYLISPNKLLDPYEVVISE